MILSSGSGTVVFVTARKEVRQTPLYKDLETTDPSLFKRLNYAKEILVNMIHPQKKVDTKSAHKKENKSPCPLQKSFPASITQT